MGALSKQERDALEEVFLSINSNNNGSFLKRTILNLRESHLSLATIRLLKIAKIGLKKNKNATFFSFFNK